MKKEIPYQRIKRADFTSGMLELEKAAREVAEKAYAPYSLSLIHISEPTRPY